jgi:hypothetical protein
MSCVFFCPLHAYLHFGQMMLHAAGCSFMGHVWRTSTPKINAKQRVGIGCVTCLRVEPQEWVPHCCFSVGRADHLRPGKRRTTSLCRSTSAGLPFCRPIRPATTRAGRCYFVSTYACTITDDAHFAQQGSHNCHRHTSVACRVRGSSCWATWSALLSTTLWFSALYCSYPCCRLGHRLWSS